MPGRIAIFLHQPRCSVQCTNGIIDALSPFYSFKVFTRHELEDSFFKDVDIICFPGGVGDSDSYEFLMKIHQNQVRNFVASGGRYLGICMGAYWADTDYFGLLDNVRVQQYIKSPNTDTRRPHAKHMPVTWRGNSTNMYFYDGCTFTGTGKFETVATYPNHAPMAIFQSRVGLIGCHPEADKFWYDEYSWMRKKWQGSQKHLLLQFVNELMTK